MDQSSFTSMLSTSLGGSLIDVELGIVDYQHAFDIAKKTFIQKGNNNLNKNFMVLPVTAGQRSYVLTANPNTDPIIDTVVRMIRPSYFSLGDPFSMSIFNSIFNYTHLSAAGSIGGGLLSYELTAQLL